MKKRLQNYLNQLELIDYSSLSADERKYLKSQLYAQIQFFQHERLIHLIITAMFGIIEFLAIIIFLIEPSIATILLGIVILCLLLPYIFHYYFLENGVQKLYIYYDKLILKN